MYSLLLKDLKIYKKIREHERQQHKEEIRKKIMRKQQQMVQEILCEHINELSERINNTINSSNYDDESLVKVKIKCIPKDKENQPQRYAKEEFDVPVREPLNMIKNKCKKVNLIEDSCLNRKDGNCMNSKSSSNVQRSKCDNQSFINSYSMQNVYNASYDINKYNTVSQEQPLRSKPILSDCGRPISAPNILENNRKSRSKSILSDQSTTVRSQSLPRTKSSSCSTHKSCKILNIKAKNKNFITSTKVTLITFVYSYQALEITSGSSKKYDKQKMRSCSSLSKVSGRMEADSISWRSKTYDRKMGCTRKNAWR